MKIILKTLSAAIVLSASTFAAADDNLVKNGGFEDPPIPAGTFSIYNEIPGWIKTSDSCGNGGIEIDNHVAGPSAYKGEQFVELDSNCPSGMSQTLKTHGKSNMSSHNSSHSRSKYYELCFAYSPRPGVVDNRILVRWDNTDLMVIDRDGSKLSDNNWHKYCVSYLKATTSKTVLEFVDVSANDTLGGHIDDVSVKEQQ